MLHGILGNKVGMSQIVEENGKVTPVTYVYIPDNEVVQIKKQETNGYDAVVLGIEPVSQPTKQRKFKSLKEFRVDSLDGVSLGDTFSIDVIEGEESLMASGTSKGKGFSGQVKRWNRSIARKTHGTKYIRHGSTMNCSITGRTKKGLKMAGRYGNETITLKKVTPVKTDKDLKVVAIRGALPGPSGGLVILKKI